MLQPGAGGAIRDTFVSGGNIPLPKERYELIVKGIGAVWLKGDTGIGSLFDIRVDDPLSPVFDITFALPSCVGTSGAVRGLEITLECSSFSAALLGDAKEWDVGVRLLTRTFRLLQVVHPFELPGIPTMLLIVDYRLLLGRRA